MNNLTDQQIILLVKGGNKEAFGLLVDRYKHMVYTSTYRLLRNKEDAEEVAQDVFLKAYTSLKSFRGDAKFSTWLYKIAYRKSLDRFKRRKTVEFISVDAMDGSFQPAYTAEGMTQLETDEKKQIIRKAILELPGDESWIVTMFYLEELSLKEISAITGYNSNTIKVKLFRNRERLYKVLKEKLEPEIIETYEGRSRKKTR